jgi:TPR repeat protein
VISLAALLNHTSILLENPLDQSAIEYMDVAAIARLLEDLGHTERAVQLYEVCLQSELPQDVYNDTLYRLSFLHKHNNDYSAAIPLWEKASSRNQIYAYEELAKYYEHYTQNLEMAHHWTLMALEQLNSSDFHDPDKNRWNTEFQHRLQRLNRKISTQEN